jgi:hypothetical protein
MRFHLSFLTAAVLLVLHAPAVFGQSLGDVARKEEERRKTLKGDGKVYTNKDLGSAALATPSVPVSGDPAEAVDAADAAAAAGKDKPAAGGAQPAQESGEKPAARDQAYWSKRMQQLRTTLERDQTYVDALQSRINALNADFVNRDDPAQRSVIEADRQKALTELERLKKQIEEGRKAIEELEEEARRAGVPPGWLR